MSAELYTLKKPNQSGQEVTLNNHSISKTVWHSERRRLGNQTRSEGARGAMDETVSEAQYSTSLC